MRQRLQLERFNESLPEQIGDYVYSLVHLPRANYPIYCRQHTVTLKKEVLLNPNDMEHIGQIGMLKVSPCGAYLAYTVDRDGNEEYEAYIKDLRSGKTKKLSSKARSVEWSTTSALYYSVPDHMHRPYKIFRHNVNQPFLCKTDPDELVLKNYDAKIR